MTNEATVKFDVTRSADVPRPGQRKTVRVNGRPEVLYVKDVDVEAYRRVDWPTERSLGLGWRGTYTLVEFHTLATTWENLQ